MRRHAEGGAPITVLSCDNLLSAGNTTKAAGAIFSDEVEKYELVKLRLLNGGHSLIAYLGGLDRQETIPDSSGQDFVHQCTRAALVNEYLPSIDLPSGFDPDALVAHTAFVDRVAHFAEVIVSEGVRAAAAEALAAGKPLS